MDSIEQKAETAARKYLATYEKCAKEGILDQKPTEIFMALAELAIATRPIAESLFTTARNSNAATASLGRQLLELPDDDLFADDLVFRLFLRAVARRARADAEDLNVDPERTKEAFSRAFDIAKWTFASASSTKPASK